MQNENGPTPFDGDVVEQGDGGEGKSDPMPIQPASDKKENKGTQSGDPDRVNLELLWHRELVSCGDYAVHVDSEGYPILYHWDKYRWVVVHGDHMVDRHVRSFITTKHKASYSNGRIRSCVDATTNIVYGYGKHLAKEKERAMLDTRDHVLEVLDGGQIVRHEKTAKAPKLYRNFIDISLKYSDFDADSGYYIPRPQEEIERNTLWGKLVSDCFPLESDRRVFQEFMGDLFSPVMRKAFPILVGEKDSGKSQILEVIAGVLTDAKAGDISELDGFQMAPFVGCSTIIVDEMGKRIDEKRVKRLVGGAVITIQRKYKDTLSIVPDFKIIGGVNEMPTIAEKSGAVESRFYILPVKKHKGPAIAQIAKKITQGYTEHRDGVAVIHRPETKDVMDWALQGLQRVMARGRLLRQDELSKEAQEMLDGMRKESNPALDFVEEYGIVPSGGVSFVPKAEVYAMFVKWAEERGRSGLARISINVWARDMFKAAMARVHGDGYDPTSDTRKTVTTTRGRRRVDCFAIRITGAYDVAHIEEEVAYGLAPVAVSNDPSTNPGGADRRGGSQGNAVHGQGGALVTHPDEIDWNLDNA